MVHTKSHVCTPVVPPGATLPDATLPPFPPPANPNTLSPHPPQYFVCCIFSPTACPPNSRPLMPAIDGSHGAPGRGGLPHSSVSCTLAFLPISLSCMGYDSGHCIQALVCLHSLESAWRCSVVPVSGNLEYLWMLRIS